MENLIFAATSQTGVMQEVSLGSESHAASSMEGGNSVAQRHRCESGQAQKAVWHGGLLRPVPDATKLVDSHFCDLVLYYSLRVEML